MYRIVKDDDGHYYVIPESQSENFTNWLNAVYDGQPTELDFTSCRVSLYHLRFSDFSV